MFSEARKAYVAAAIALLTPILTYVAATGDWSWRAFAGSVISGLIAGLSVYNTPNEPPPVDDLSGESFIPKRHARHREG
jgi:hypothetical protein